jgi:recombination protein RecR
MNSGVVENLINELSKLPGIGRKTAQRLCFFIMGMPEQEAVSIANAIIEIKNKARFCRRCFNITEEELCSICTNSGRDKSKICVVEEPSTLIVIENTRATTDSIMSCWGPLPD